MRTIYSFLSLLIFGASIASFINKPNHNILKTAKDITKNLAKVTDSLYVWKFEVSNEEYRLFQINSNSKHALDTTNWVGSLTNNPAYVSKYHTHPAFNSYPVVNVSYDNATAYCNWLTEKYNNDEKRKFKKVQFKLPTQAEWVQAASGGRSKAIYPWGTYGIRDKKGNFNCNIRIVADSQIFTDTISGTPKFVTYKKTFDFGSSDKLYFYTANVKSFRPNDYGIYNFSGNVAEMTAEKGISKGGSFLNYGGDVTIQALQYYTSTKSDLGFRVFMSVIEK